MIITFFILFSGLAYLNRFLDTFLCTKENRSLVVSTTFNATLFILMLVSGLSEANGQ